MSLKKRITFGRLGTFVPTGRIVRLGPSTSYLGDVVEYGEARTIRIVVGRNKGRLDQNREGECGTAPPTFTPEQIDRTFLSARAAQVGRANVGATRVSGQGWYEGEPEDSVAYEVAFIPNDSEQAFADFQEHMNDLALSLAEAFCQDSVLILRDDGIRRTVAAASWEP